MQTMVQWAAGEKRLGVGTAVVSFSRTMGGVMGASLAAAALLGALQVKGPNARDVLSRALASIGSRQTEIPQVVPALVGAYRWMFISLGTLLACATVVAWSIPNLDLATRSVDNPAISVSARGSKVLAAEPSSEEKDFA
jgi:membrane associated rhomboid family serine protease